MTTHEEVIRQGAEQQAEVARRERVFITRATRHRTRTIIGTTSVALATALVMLMAWHETWWFALLSLLPGALAGLIIARLRCGILLSMLIYTAIQTTYVVIGYRLSGWSFGEDGMAAMGGVIWTFMMILSWPVIGGYLGFRNDAFEHQHAQI